jgi:integrase
VRIGLALGAARPREQIALREVRSRALMRLQRRDDDLVNHRPREALMPSTVLVDIAGRRRSPATLPALHAGRPPHNKGLRYAADPPTVEEIIAVMHAAGDDAEGVRLRGLIVVLWRAGLRINEALSLTETDLDRRPARSWSGAARTTAAAR